MSTVEFRCRLSETTGALRALPHFWEHTVGSGHAPLALRADWQEQLRRCHEELGFRHVRFHGLLCDDVGILVDDRDQLLYSFFNADQIWDFLLSIGMKPFIELSFMPTTLASGGTTVFHYRGNVTPPKDYKQWATLIRKLVTHWVKRYGVEEVRTWFFEVWNEPNLQAFWPSTQAAYFKLYRSTVQAIKEVDDRLQVGGPATAKNELNASRFSNAITSNQYVNVRRWFCLWRHAKVNRGWRSFASVCREGVIEVIFSKGGVARILHCNRVLADNLSLFR